MELIIDIGNSNHVFALLDEGEVTHTLRVPTKKSYPKLFYHGVFTDFLLEHQITASDITRVTISSVVSELINIIQDAVFRYFGIKAIFLTGEILEKLPFRVPKPYEIGTDLVANAYSAIYHHATDAIIIDFGTALTFTVVSKEEGILGVTIAPGLKTSMRSLSRKTSKLPEVELELPESVIGKDTSSAIQAGVLYGYIGLIKEVVHRIREESDRPLSLIATGGMSEVLHPLQDYFDIRDPHLTLKGIFGIASIQ